jgi:hypothetical protein
MAVLICSSCGMGDRRLDEHDRCEQCVMDAERRACRLDELEDAIDQLRAVDLTDEQVRAAVELKLANRPGRLPGDFVQRQKDTLYETGPAGEPSPVLDRDRHGWTFTDSAFATIEVED